MRQLLLVAYNSMDDVTQLLHKWRDGSPEAENELFDLVLPKLRRLARFMMNGERKGHSMQPTELIDQVYLRLVRAKDRDWENRAHFFAVVGRAMRRHLIDHARARPHAQFVALTELKDFLPASAAQVELAITVDRLLDKLAETQPAWCRLVEVKYFLGLTDEEAADVLGLKLRTTQRMWMDARQWLYAQMQEKDEPEETQRGDASTKVSRGLRG
jgi:RNA polymerase sigma factor (TIGR02999 family)